VLVGLAGDPPALPGVPLVLAGLAIAAWSDGFTRVGLGTLAILAALTALSVALDLLAASFATRRLGAAGSRPPARQRARSSACRSASSACSWGRSPEPPSASTGRCATCAGGRRRRNGWLGLALAVAARFAVAFTMLGLFALAWFL
jgi:hypothetical protein